MDDVIVAHNLGKQYVRYSPKRPTTLGEVLAQGLRSLRPTQRTWALRHVNFAIPRGRTVGIIGVNGAGKSTLLRLLGSIAQPDEGTIVRHGRIGALLDLGAGFHPDLTGRENVFVSGVIAGLNRREVVDRFDEIVEFAEMAQRIDDPLRTYSTGMQMRLAFAVAAHIDPDILLIDEVLAVGDVAFQRKCIERINQFKNQGCTIILVSHDSLLVQHLCDEVIWLHGGEVAAHGRAEVVLPQYIARTSGSTKQPNLPTPQLPWPKTELKLNENRFGSQEMIITNVRLLDRLGQENNQVASGTPVQVQISYQAPQWISAPIFGAMLLREDGFVCFETNTQTQGVPVPALQGAGEITLNLDRLDLTAGRYYVDVGVYEQNWRYPYDYHWRVYSLCVYDAAPGKGLLQPPHHWQIPTAQQSY